MDKRNLLDDSIIPVPNDEINGGITMVQRKAENIIPFSHADVCFIAINDGVDSAKEDDDFAPVARSQLVGIRELSQWNCWDYSTTAPYRVSNGIGWMVFKSYLDIFVPTNCIKKKVFVDKTVHRR